MKFLMLSFSRRSRRKFQSNIIRDIMHDTNKVNYKVVHSLLFMKLRTVYTINFILFVYLLT